MSETEPVPTVTNYMEGAWLLNGTPPPHLNLVFRIQKRGEMVAGTIEYNINGALSGKFWVHDLGIIGGAIAFGMGQPKGSYPEITYKWRELYASW